MNISKYLPMFNLNCDKTFLRFLNKAQIILFKDSLFWKSGFRRRESHAEGLGAGRPSDTQGVGNGVRVQVLCAD